MAVFLPWIVAFIYPCKISALFKYGGGIYQIFGMLMVVWGINNRSKYYLDKSLFAQFLGWVKKPKPRNIRMSVDKGRYKLSGGSARLRNATLTLGDISEVIEWINNELDAVYKLIRKNKDEMNSLMKDNLNLIKNEIDDLKLRLDDQKRHFTKGQVEFIPVEVIGVLLIITGLVYSTVS
jgi:hypothetical protein